VYVDCADVGITRTPSREELLYPRSKLVTTAKAFGLQAIDLVSTDAAQADRAACLSRP
jgi:citrate lyase beta subunit